MSTSYDSRTIFLHWATAALVLTLWISGQCIDFFPKGTWRIIARSLHISIGLLLGIILVARLAWRAGQGSQLPAQTGAVGVVGRVFHAGLYLLLVGIVAIGLACVWIRGDNLFNLFTVPAFDPTNKTLRHDAVELHGLIANILLASALFHAAAGLWHHFVRRDGVLKRMWPNL